METRNVAPSNTCHRNSDRESWKTFFHLQGRAKVKSRVELSSKIFFLKFLDTKENKSEW